jgi:hypothetical protein
MPLPDEHEGLKMAETRLAMPKKRKEVVRSCAAKMRRLYGTGIDTFAYMLFITSCADDI